jgi:hypothetical protein
MPPYPSWEAWIIETIEEALRHSSLHVEADMGGKQAVLDANEEHITEHSKDDWLACSKMVQPFQDFLLIFFKLPLEMNHVRITLGST